MLSIRQGSARKRYDHEEAKVELSELGMRRGNSPSDVGRDSKHIRNGVQTTQWARGIRSESPGANARPGKANVFGQTLVQRWMKLLSQGHCKPRNSCRSSILTCKKPGLRYSRSWPCYDTWMREGVRLQSVRALLDLVQELFSQSKQREFEDYMRNTLRQEGLRGNDIRLYEKPKNEPIVGADLDRLDSSIPFWYRAILASQVNTEISGDILLFVRFQIN
jgi:hypothetical protein